jgi:hypothetical protein
MKTQKTFFRKKRKSCRKRKKIGGNNLVKDDALQIINSLKNYLKDFRLTNIEDFSFEVENNNNNYKIEIKKDRQKNFFINIIKNNMVIFIFLLNKQNDNELNLKILFGNNHQFNSIHKSSNKTTRNISVGCSIYFICTIQNIVIRT